MRYYYVLAWLALTGMHGLLALRFRIAAVFEEPAHGYALVGVGLLIGVVVFAGSLWQAHRQSSPSSGTAEPHVWWGWMMLLIALLIGTLFRYDVMVRHPVDSAHGDMLPLIIAACEILLNGQFPYITHAVPWELPLTFMPGLWLPYVPFVWSGIDPRWLGVAAIWGVSISLFMVVHRGPRRARLGGVLILLPFLFSPAWVDFTIQGQTLVLWFYMALFSVFVLRGNVWGTALMLGVLIVSRQTFLLLLPPTAVWLYVHCPRRVLIRCALCLFAPIALLLLPFVWLDPDAVLLEPLHHYRELEAYELKRAGDGYLAQTPGLTYALHRAGEATWMSWLPWVVLLCTWGGAWFYARRPIGLLAGSGVGLLVLNLITPIPWYYIFAPPLVLMGMALAASMKGLDACE